MRTIFSALIFCFIVTHAYAQAPHNSLVMRGGQPNQYYSLKDSTGLYYLAYYDSNSVEHRITPSVFEEMDIEIYGRFLVKKDGKYGFIDDKGSVVIPCVYDNATRFSNKMAVVLYNCQTGIIDLAGNLTLLSKEYSYVLPFSFNRAVVIYNNKYGVINTKGIEVVPTIYSAIWGYENHIAIVKDSLIGAIDTNGTLVLKPTFYNISSFNANGFAEIAEPGLKNNVYHTYKGLVYKDGTVILPPIFDVLEISNTNSNVTILTEKNHYKKKQFHINKGLHIAREIIDTATVYSATGKPIFSIPKAKIIDLRFNNYYCLANDTLYVINEKGVNKIPGVKSAHNLFFNYTTYIIYTTGKNQTGICNVAGKIVCPPVYYKITESYTSGHLMALRKGTIDIINTDFKVIKSIVGNHISSPFRMGSKWENNYTIVYTYRQHNKYGILDSAYNMVMPTLYKRIHLNNQYIVYKQKSKYGALTINYQPLLPAQYSAIQYEAGSDNKYIKIAKGKKWGMANLQGTIIIPPIYNTLTGINYIVDTLIEGKHIGQYKTAFIAKKHSKKGLIRLNGTIILPFIYNAIGYSECDYFTVKQHKKMGVVNLKGELVIPMIYKSVYFTGANRFEVSNGKHQCGLVDINNKVIIPLEYDYIRTYSYSFLYQPYFLVKRNDLWGMCDTLGRMLYKPEYDMIKSISSSDKNTALFKGGKVGLGDKNGVVLLPIKYDEINEWVDGLYSIRLGSGPTATYGVANINGKIIVEPYYKAAQITYYRNTVIVTADGKQYFYNSQGQPVNDCYIDKHTNYGDIMYIIGE